MSSIYVCPYIFYIHIYEYIYVYIYIDEIIFIIKENRQAPVVRNQPILTSLFADFLEIWSFTNNGLQKRIAQTVKYFADGI